MTTANPVLSSSDAPSEVSDVSMGAASAKPANDTAPPESAEKAPEGEPGEKPAAEDIAIVATIPDPSKLERARAVARAKHAQWMERQQLQHEAQRRTYEATQATQYAHQERARAEAAQQQLDAIKADPMAALAYLEKAGLSPKVLAQKAVEASTPEAKLRVELEAKLESRIAEIQGTYQAELAKMQERELASQRAQQMVVARQHFITEASDASQFPAVAHLVGLGDKWRASLVEEATRVLHEAYQRTGQEYSNREVLSFLNEKYAELIPSAQQKNESSKSNVGSEAKKEAPPNGTGAEEKSAAGTPRTLTNKAAQVKGSMPPDFDTLSDSEQRKILAAIYRQTSRA